MWRRWRLEEKEGQKKRKFMLITITYMLNIISPLYAQQVCQALHLFIFTVEIHGWCMWDNIYRIIIRGFQSKNPHESQTWADCLLSLLCFRILQFQIQSEDLVTDAYIVTTATQSDRWGSVKTLFQFPALCVVLSTFIKQALLCINTYKPCSFSFQRV